MIIPNINMSYAMYMYNNNNHNTKKNKNKEKSYFDDLSMSIVVFIGKIGTV